MLALLTLAMPSYGLPGLNVKIPDLPPSSHILDRDSGPIYSELEKTLTFMLKNPETDFCYNEEEYYGHRAILLPT